MSKLIKKIAEVVRVSCRGESTGCDDGGDG